MTRLDSERFSVFLFRSIYPTWFFISLDYHAQLHMRIYHAYYYVWWNVYIHSVLCDVTMSFGAYCVYSFCTLSITLACPQPPQNTKQFTFTQWKKRNGRHSIWHFTVLWIYKCVHIHVCVCVCVFVDISRFSCLFFSGFLQYIVIQICKLHLSQTTREMNTDNNMAKENRHLGIFLFYRSVYTQKSYVRMETFFLAKKRRRRRRKEHNKKVA